MEGEKYHSYFSSSNEWFWVVFVVVSLSSGNERPPLVHTRDLLTHAVFVELFSLLHFLSLSFEPLDNLYHIYFPYCLLLQRFSFDRTQIKTDHFQWKIKDWENLGNLILAHRHIVERGLHIGSVGPSNILSSWHCLAWYLQLVVSFLTMMNSTIHGIM